MSESEDSDDLKPDHQDNEQGEESEEEIQRRKIRDNLSTLSFEELIKLKEEVGAKVYNETIYGTSQSEKGKKQREFKRTNKNRPREISSKIRPKQIRSILSNNSTFAPTKSKNPAPRDPRFDPSCGDFDKVVFKQNYEFINDLRQKERTKLQEEYNECTDRERKNTIKLLLQRMDNQIREEHKAIKERQKEEDEKTEIKEKLRKGEKPLYKKKSVKKLEGLVEKYEELKKSNRLQKHIQKRTKKLELKDRKVLSKIKH